MKVKTYHDLKMLPFKQMRERMTLTRIHGKPTWYKVENLVQECKAIVLDCQTSYSWSGQYVFLVEIQGTAQKPISLTLVYVPPVQPPNQHAEILPVTITHITSTLTAENDLHKHDWAIIT